MNGNDRATLELFQLDWKEGVLFTSCSVIDRRRGSVILLDVRGGGPKRGGSEHRRYINMPGQYTGPETAE